MAKKQRRPSGDEVVDSVVVTPEAVCVPNADVSAVELPEGCIHVDLLDDNRSLIARVAIRADDKAFRIHHDGKAWDHVADHADGTWQFVCL